MGWTGEKYFKVGDESGRITAAIAFSSSLDRN